MPRITLSHAKLVRVINALLADTARRQQLAERDPSDATMHEEVAAENRAIIEQLNAARTKDGLLPISYHRPRAPR